MIVDAILREIYTSSRPVAPESAQIAAVPENLKRFFAGTALKAVETASCCEPSEQAACCEPAAKASCCGDTSATDCGCR
jgi:hypothetical protein